MQGTVLVTDGEERAALAIVRSLGRAGWRVVVVSSSTTSLAGCSRFATSHVTAPNPLTDPAGFAAGVVTLARTLGARFVIPVGEAALLSLLERREDLPVGAIPWPAIEQVRAICDKARVLAAAAPLGICIPRQVAMHSRADADTLEGAALPVVIKPARSVAGAPGGRQKFGVSHAATPAQLRAAIAALPDAAFPVLVQERVVGPGIGIFVLRWDGAVRAAFSHQRIREKPPAGGVSVYREAIALDPALLQRSLRLLEAFDWQGVAMVEYKVNQETGVPVLMEINGRFWGSLQLAVDAGVDFPALLLACATGAPPAEAAGYRAGGRLRWWWGDVDHLLARLRRSPAALGLPPGAPGRWQVLRDVLRRDPASQPETWRRDDPAPFRHETLRWLRGA